MVLGPATFSTGCNPMVFVTTPPHPASNAFSILRLLSVGGADAMEEKGSGGVGVKLIQELKSDLANYLERKGHSSIEDLRGLARDRIVEHAQVRRKSGAYNGGYAKAS